MRRESEDTILIVNDSPDQLEMVSVVLRQSGYRVLTADDGLAGYELARQAYPSLILSDVHMPRASGIELCRRLRADGRLRMTPVLLVSALRKDTASVLEGLAAGADDYLEAPYDPLRLVAKIARLLERAHAEGHYHDLVEQAGDIIYTHDLEGRLTSINNAGALFSGRPQADLIGLHVGEALNLADAAEKVQEAIVKLRQEGARREQALLISGDGEPRWFEFNQWLICDRAGVPIGVRGVGRDLTEHIRTEQALRESEAKFRSLADASFEGIAIHERGVIIEANQAFAALSGYALPEVIGQPILNFAAPESHETIRQNFAASMLQSYEILILRRDGSTLPCEIRVREARYRNRAVRVVVLRDLTAHKRHEAALRESAEQEAENEKMRSLGQLSAGVAHNFNNALTAILGRTQLLLRTATNEKQRHSLGVIETAAQDAAEIVRRIQTFARRTPVRQFSRVSLASLITDALQLMRTRWEDEARAHGLRYDVRFINEVEDGDQLEVSASEVREVFVNLIFNALEAMPAGGIVTIRESRTPDALVVAVEDTGQGVAEEYQPRIFEPFFTTKGSQGSGLGLAVSYGIIMRHGGTIEVASRPGEGTTFTICFPVKPLDETTPAAATTTNDLPSRRVLVVDDEAQVREVLVEMLRALGQHVVSVSDAADALKALAAERFDVLLTDLSMPGTDGLTLAQEARRRAPHLRIVLATGYGQSAPGNAKTGGVIDLIISKPFQLSEVEAALRAPAHGDT